MQSEGEWKRGGERGALLKWLLHICMIALPDSQRDTTGRGRLVCCR